MFYGSYRDRLQNKLNKYKKIPTVLWIWIHWIRMRIQHFKWIKIRIRIFFFFMYVIQHCFICRPSESTVSEDAGIKPRSVATLALTARRCNHSARTHSHSARSHSHSARSHPHSARSHPVLNPVCRYSWEINHSFGKSRFNLQNTVWGHAAVHNHSLWLQQGAATANLTTCKTLPPTHPSQPISTCSPPYKKLQPLSL